MGPCPTIGTWTRPVAYLWKELDPWALAQRLGPGNDQWPTSGRSLTRGRRMAHVSKIGSGRAALDKDADKLTMGQKLNIVAPHAVGSSIRQPREMAVERRVTHYQSLLLNKDSVQFCPPTPSTRPPCYLRRPQRTG